MEPYLTAYNKNTYLLLYTFIRILKPYDFTLLNIIEYNFTSIDNKY